jgi:hypothetical protein
MNFAGYLVTAVCYRVNLAGMGEVQLISLQRARSWKYRLIALCLALGLLSFIFPIPPKGVSQGVGCNLR